MIQVQCRAVLLDIEGTVSPVAFVFDVMFPFIRKNVSAFLENNWQDPAVQNAVALVGVDVGQDDVGRWLDKDAGLARKTVCKAVNDLMDRDAKVTGLKQLQGLIWRDGFESGELVATLFADVLPALNTWKSNDLDLYIYSSGSIAAQKLFFGHTTEGDLLSLFSGHFDTTSGNKKETGSYSTIAGEIGLAPSSICFVSDVAAELDAAATSGMQTVLRPATDDTDDEKSGHPIINGFDELEIQPSA